MGLFDWLSKKKKEPEVIGTLEYLPGSQSFGEDEPVVLEEGQLRRRLFVQPAPDQAKDHSSIPIYTGNPFRDLAQVSVQPGIVTSSQEGKISL